MFAVRAKFGFRIGLAALAAAAGLSVAGCADLARVTSITPQPLDTNSAVAAQVRAATRTSYPRPSFRDVPAIPQDVPAPGAFRTAVTENGQARDNLEGWIATHPAMAPLDSAQTEAFAADQRARIPPGEMTRQAPVGTEDYAAQLRALAAPPPPPK